MNTTYTYADQEGNQQQITLPGTDHQDHIFKVKKMNLDKVMAGLVETVERPIEERLVQNIKNRAKRYSKKFR